MREFVITAVVGALMAFLAGMGLGYQSEIERRCYGVQSEECGQ